MLQPKPSPIRNDSGLRSEEAFVLVTIVDGRPRNEATIELQIPSHPSLVPDISTDLLRKILTYLRDAQFVEILEVKLHGNTKTTVPKYCITDKGRNALHQYIDLLRQEIAVHVDLLRQEIDIFEAFF